MTRRPTVEASPLPPAGAPVTELRAAAWRVVADAGRPVTALWLAEAAGITCGGAYLWLRQWAAAGRLTLGNPPAGKHAPHRQPYLPPGVARWRVLVTGSRTWTDTARIGSVLADLDHTYPGRLSVVHGGCPDGADAIADAWCRRHSVAVETYPADWTRHGKAAGPRRNAAMVATGPDQCMAFIHDASPGATGCARLAEAAGIRTTRHTHTTRKERTVMPTAPGDTPLLAAALGYAARGWHVIPLRPNDKRPAFPAHPADRCDRTDPRCTPGHTGWEQRATTDPDRITRAWTAHPYGIGIACGPSGLVVIDLDKPKDGGTVSGAVSFAVLCEQAGQREPVDTFTVHTGRSGTHLYYTHPAGGPQLRNTASTLGPLIDTRAHGGYVVAAPSIVNGLPYKVIRGTAAAPLPGWLAERLQPAPLPEQAPVAVPVPEDRHGAYVYAALTAETDRVLNSGPQQHNTALYRAAVALGQLVAGGAIDPDTVTALLAGAAATVGQPEGEAARTIASGLRAGANRPRQVAA